MVPGFVVKQKVALRLAQPPRMIWAMNIGMFTDVYRPSINGVTRSIDAARESLEARGHTVYVIAPHARRTSPDQFVIRLPSIKRLSPPTTPIAVSFAPFVIEAVRPLKLDIVHSHLPFTIGSIGHSIARELQLPIIHTYHTHLTEYAHYAPPLPGLRRSVRFGLRRLSRQFCNSADQVIAPSTAIKHLLLGYGVTKPITVLPSGIRTQDFGRISKADRFFTLKKYSIPENQKIILFGGRLAREKNLPFLLKAYQQLASRRKDVHLVLAGGGPVERSLARKVQAMQLESRITMTGMIAKEEIAKLFGVADAFAFPSVTETQGIVIAEALAAGCPVVAIDAMGSKDSVVDGVNGYLVPLSTIAFAERLENVVSDQQHWQQLSLAAKQSAELFSIEHVTDQLIDLYQISRVGK